MDNATQGRDALRAWEASKQENFFSADPNLQWTLRFYMGQAGYEAALRSFIHLGEFMARVIDPAAQVEDRLGNHPRLQRWSGIGERVEAIEFHPNHDLIGRKVWRSGVMALQAEPGRTVQQMGLYYLLAHAGEGAQLCALACTSGLIRVLQQAASPAVREKFLPPLLETDYHQMQHGAQFLTEIQGGSDVGTNAVTASDQGDGTWRISGEKWFCSNINADQFLMTARPEDAPDGTRGLGLFLVPRRLDEGTTNGFYIRRLKDKIGTRTLASAEVDFQDALAYPVGALDQGFKNVVNLVLNTSRLMNAVGSAGIMRRATLEASTYACHRTAFGQPIASYPLVQEALADMLSQTCAALSSSLYVAHLLDSMETGQASDDDHAVFRLLVNLNKYITSIRATETVHRAIEVLGGNGAIESFSILPRLYRDMIVLESWEGTHNVLCLQVLRDIARYHLHEPFTRDLRQKLDAIQHPDLLPWAEITRAALDDGLRLLARLDAGGEQYAQAHARRLADQFAQTAQAALLLREAQWELDEALPTAKPDITAYFINRHLRPGYDPLDDDTYLPRLSRLMQKA